MSLHPRVHFYNTTVPQCIYAKQDTKEINPFGFQNQCSHISVNSKAEVLMIHSLLVLLCTFHPLWCYSAQLHSVSAYFVIGFQKDVRVQCVDLMGLNRK